MAAADHHRPSRRGDHVLITKRKDVVAERADGVPVTLHGNVRRGDDDGEGLQNLLLHHILVVFIAHVDGAIVEKLRTGGALVLLTDACSIVGHMLMTVKLFLR